MIKIYHNVNIVISKFNMAGGIILGSISDILQVI